MTEAVSIERGSVLVYRTFDVAEAIDLVALEANARAATGHFPPAHRPSRVRSWSSRAACATSPM